MTKPQIASLFVLTGVGGFLMGWLASGKKPDPVAPATHAAEARESKPAEPGPIRHEFKLRPADVQADRETPAVAVDGKGRVLLAWASQTGDLERTLTLATSSDGGKTFEPPVAWRKVPIYRYASKSKGKEVMYSTHVLPRLAVNGDAIDLGWVEAIDGGPSVVYQVARSVDGGRSFSEPVRVHGGEAVKPGFTAMSSGPDGSVLCAWLDGRAKGPKPFASVRPADSEGFEPDQMVFDGPDGKGVCPCCDVAVTQAPNGSRFVAFRNSEAGNRDIFVSRTRPGAAGFSIPVPVGLDHWKLDGCPHDGPSLAVVADRLHVVWMDAHSGKNRVYQASSPTTELDFAARELAPASAGAQGHPRLAATPNGQLLAVWDESIGEAPKESGPSPGHGHGPSLTGGGRAIMLAAGSGDGFGASGAIAARPGAFQLQPSIVSGPDGTAFVAWNEIDADGKRVVFARVARREGAR